MTPPRKAKNVGARSWPSNHDESLFTMASLRARNQQGLSPHCSGLWGAVCCGPSRGRSPASAPILAALGLLALLAVRITFSSSQEGGRRGFREHYGAAVRHASSDPAPMMAGAAAPAWLGALRAEADYVDEHAAPQASAPVALRASAAAAAPASSGPISVREAIGEMLLAKPAEASNAVVIIRTGTMRAIVPIGVDAVVRSAEEAVALVGGYVERARISRSDDTVRAYAATGVSVNGSTSADLTFRVPVAKFDLLRSRLRRIVAAAAAPGLAGARPPRIDGDDVDAEDATAEHADLATRLAVERASLAQMEALLRAVTNVSEALLVKAQLDEITRRIEGIKARREWQACKNPTPPRSPYAVPILPQSTSSRHGGHCRRSASSFS